MQEVKDFVVDMALIVAAAGAFTWVFAYGMPALLLKFV